MVLWWCLLFGLIVAIMRLVYVLPFRITQIPKNEKRGTYRNDDDKLYKGSSQLDKKKVMVVLGSGGHTTEMLKLMSKFESLTCNTDVVFIVAASDQTSVAKVDASESSVKPSKYICIPRSREVGQGWISSCATSMIALWKTFQMMLKEYPDLIVCNGPGTCIPVCAIAFLFRYCGIKRSSIIFCESFCRVKSLSLTGRLLYPIVDRFIVLWPQLLERYPRAEYFGVLV